MAVTVKAHSGDGEYVDGIYQPASKEIFERTMVVIPVMPDDFKCFENVDESETDTISIGDMKFYDGKMDVDIEDNDIIIKDDIEYEIISVINRSDRGFKIYFGKKEK